MNARTAWWMIGLLVVVGCVPSLNAIYTDKDIVFNPEVLGVWQQENAVETWEFQRRDAKSYRLVYTDRNGHSGLFVAHLADIEGTQFLDLFPQQIEDGTPAFYQFHQVPIHSIYLVKETGDKIVLAAMDGEWLEQYMKQHSDEVPCATFNSRRILTASTEQLQRFLVDNKHRLSHHFVLERSADLVVD